MKKYMYALITVGVTAFQWYWAWAGTHGDLLSWNLFRFLLWILILVDIVVLLVVAGSRLEAYKPKEGRASPLWDRTPRLLPRAFAPISDVLLAFFIAAYGHFFYAFLVMAQMMMDQLAITMIEQARAEESKVAESEPKEKTPC